MAKLQVECYNTEGKSSGQVALPEKVFGVPYKRSVVNTVLKWYLAGLRQGTHSTKTRAEVSGGGHKPWRQKGTGRARAGSNRSPLWRGGGIAFGPKPRDYSYALPQKVRTLALRMVLSERLRKEHLKVVDVLSVNEGKCKEMKKIVENLGLSKKIVFIVDKVDEKTKRAAANLANVTLIPVNGMNITNLAYSEWVVFTKGAVEQI